MRVINILIIVLLLELLSWTFARMIKTIVSLKYLIIQNYFVSLGLLLLLTFPGSLWIPFLIKLGLPPLHLWFFFISISVNVRIFLFFRTIHKLLPILCISKLLMRFMTLIVIYGISSLLLFQVRMFHYVMFCSSLVHTCWILFSASFRAILLLTYFTIYSLLLFRLLGTLKVNRNELLTISQTRHTRIVWLGLSGIPPLVFFWFKALIVLHLIKMVYDSIAMVLRLIAVLALASYFRVYHLRLNVRETSFYFRVPVVSVVLILISF